MQINTNVNDTLVVYMHTLFDKELAYEKPPFSGVYNEEPQLQQLMLDNARSAAPYYDSYQVLIQLSFLDMRTNRIRHFFMCEDGVELPLVIDDRTTVTYASTEQDLVKGIHEYIWCSYPAVQTQLGVVTPVNFAGWKINVTTWPFLVNRMLAYNLLMPDYYRTLPQRRFSSVDYLYDISTIYTQGIASGFRRLPALPDVLSYWGIQKDYITQSEIETLICTNPAKAAAAIAAYLEGMSEIMKRYSGTI